jgi:hypothetical protein
MASSTNNSLPYPSPRNEIERQANFEFSSRGIVGAVWDKTPSRWWIPRGLEWANDPANPLPAYLPPFFGAKKEYANDDEGWTQVSRKRKRSRRARRSVKMMEVDEIQE